MTVRYDGIHVHPLETCSLLLRVEQYNSCLIFIPDLRLPWRSALEERERERGKLAANFRDICATSAFI